MPFHIHPLLKPYSEHVTASEGLPLHGKQALPLSLQLGNTEVKHHHLATSQSDKKGLLLADLPSTL